MSDKGLIVKYYWNDFVKLFPHVTLEQFGRWIVEDDLPGGLECGTHAMGKREMIMLYCTIRAVKPKKILEIGTKEGDSLRHILRAVYHNLVFDCMLCEVHTCDIINFIKEPIEQSIPFKHIIKESLKVIPTEDYDFIFQDGNHGQNYIEHELRAIEKKGTVKTLFGHDYFQHPHVKVAYDNVPIFKEHHGFREPAYKAGFIIGKR